MRSRLWISENELGRRVSVRVMKSGEVAQSRKQYGRSAAFLQVNKPSRTFSDERAVTQWIRMFSQNVHQQFLSLLRFFMENLERKGKERKFTVCFRAMTPDS